jgi:hypothetical protein
MPAQACVLIYILFTMTAWVLVFVRAKRKRSLIKLATAHFEGTPRREEWVAACGGISWLLGDFRCLSILKEHHSTLPGHVAEAYRGYTAMSRTTYISLAFLFGFALIAYKICD